MAEQLPVELRFDIEDFGTPWEFEKSVIEVSARGPGIVDRVEHSRFKSELDSRGITGRDWVLLGSVAKNGEWWDEFALYLDVDPSWVKAQVPENIKKQAWEKIARPHRLLANSDEKIRAVSMYRYRGGAREKRLYGGSGTITEFWIYFGDDPEPMKIQGHGPSPGQRKTDAIERAKAIRAKRSPMNANAERRLTKKQFDELEEVWDRTHSKQSIYEKLRSYGVDEKSARTHADIIAAFMTMPNANSKHRKGYSVWIWEPSLQDWALEGKGYSRQVASEHERRYRHRHPGSHVSVRDDSEGKPPMKKAQLANPPDAYKTWRMSVRRQLERTGYPEASRNIGKYDRDLRGVYLSGASTAEGAHVVSRAWAGGYAALANPSGTTIAWIAGGVVVGGLVLYLLTRKKETTEEPADQQPAKAPEVSIPVELTTCDITAADVPGIQVWAAKQGFPVVLYTPATVPLAQLPSAALKNTIAVTSDGKFWKYKETTGSPYEAPELRASYCGERAKAIPVVYQLKGPAAAILPY